ncbi:MAG: family 10 glycosylhydrolase [Cyanobacteria bacterium J06598_3]
MPTILTSLKRITSQGLAQLSNVVGPLAQRLGVQISHQASKLGVPSTLSRSTIKQFFFNPKTQRLKSFPVALAIVMLALSHHGKVSPDQSNARLEATQPTAAQESPVSPQARVARITDEIRGVWITNVASGVLFSPWGVPRAMHQLADMHFNTVYPVVWNRGKTFYHSDALKKITGQTIDPLLAIAHPLKDPLAEMVELGHQRNIRVLPWFEYGFMVPMNSALAQQHPDWLTTRHNGSRQLAEETFEVIADKNAANNSGATSGLFSNLLNSGAPTQLGWLNPLHPNVQGLLIGLIEEVVTDYNVDGIQLDDHFSWPVEFGYDAYTVSLYKAEHQGQGPPANPADADWIRWRANKLSKFVNVLHARIREKCPSCTLSLSPNPAKFAYRFHLQDWRTWVDKGWIDELVVQVYRDQQDQFDSELGKDPLQVARDRIPVTIGILTGTWRRPIPFEQIKAQVESSRDRHFSGVSFFYWDTLWSYFTPEAPQQRRQNFQQLLADYPR